MMGNMWVMMGKVGLCWVKWGGGHDQDERRNGDHGYGCSGDCQEG
jgi:hypothetical protein